MTGAEILKRLNLSPHVEGGHYRLIERFGVDIAEEALPEAFRGDRNSASAIYYLLQAGEKSAWHLLQSAEIWFHLQGGLLEMTLGGKGSSPIAEKTITIGSLDHDEAVLAAVVPAQVWQTTRLVDGDYALVACVVSPAFHAADFLLLDATGEKS